MLTKIINKFEKKINPTSVKFYSISTTIYLSTFKQYVERR